MTSTVAGVWRTVRPSRLALSATAPVLSGLGGAVPPPAGPAAVPGRGRSSRSDRGLRRAAGRPFARRRNVDLWKALLPVLRCGLSSATIRRQQRIKRQQTQGGNRTSQCTAPKAATTAVGFRDETKHGAPRHPVRRNAETDSVKTISDDHMMPVEKCNDGNASYLCLYLIIQLLMIAYPFILCRY